MDKLEIRQQLNRINASLEKEYKEWEPSWKRIAELSRSFRGKFENEKNKEFPVPARPINIKCRRLTRKPAKRA